MFDPGPRHYVALAPSHTYNVLLQYFGTIISKLHSREAPPNCAVVNPSCYSALANRDEETEEDNENVDQSNYHDDED